MPILCAMIWASEFLHNIWEEMDLLLSLEDIVRGDDQSKVSSSIHLRDYGRHVHFPSVLRSISNKGLNKMFTHFVSCLKVSS